ncbi:MAG: Cyclic pyranopterin monophosphate synthase [Syntrophus sp. SKADARSKE-3]|nr:Cyclic pyranopterin monophosphate synthase [Syntrophus sp. SKADARSKE-3]
MAEDGLTHVDEKGNARMVDVTAKSPTAREARAMGSVRMQPQTLALIEDRKIPKGDVYSVARVAAIMAAKKTSDIIPMCHPLEITGVDVSFYPNVTKGDVDIDVRVRTWGRTGVEMEAMTAVSVAALTIYDMCKAVDRTITLTDIRLMAKHGGKSGDFVRET